MQVEINPAERYRLDTIAKLKQLAEFHNPKSFHALQREDILNYLDRLRKPESKDPLHKWIGTHELTRICFLRFFKWLHYPNISPSKARPVPAMMQNIPKIRRREQETLASADDIKGRLAPVDDQRTLSCHQLFFYVYACVCGIIDCEDSSDRYSCAYIFLDL